MSRCEKIAALNANKIMSLRTGIFLEADF